MTMIPHEHQPENLPVGVTPSAPPPTSKAAATINSTQIKVVVACVVGNFVAAKLIVTVSLGTFLIPISRDFQWPRERISVVLSLIAIAGALIYPVAGKLVDRFGARRVILTGILGSGTFVFSLGFLTPNFFLFYSLFFLIGVLGTFSSTMMYHQVIVRWFDRRRGIMMGLSGGLGNGLGGALIPFVTLTLITTWNWRGAFFGLGVIVIAVGFLTVFTLLKDPPRTGPGLATPVDRNAGMPLAQAVRTFGFWLTTIAVCVGAGCLLAIQTHVVPILMGRGFPAGLGTLVLSISATVGGAWAPIAGWFLDKIGTPRIVAPLYLISAAGIVALERGTALPILVAGGVALGIASATQFVALSYFTSRYFGLRCFGQITGVMYSAATIAQGLTPFLIDVDFDQHKSYFLSLHIIELILVAGAAIMISLPSYSTYMPSWRKARAAI
jgi:nitrate/nitrite transporter NarK